MNHKKNSMLFLILLICFFALSCNDSVSSSSEVQIRITNISIMDFQKVVVDFPNQQEAYGSVVRGGFSEYRNISKAYRCAYIEVTAEGDNYILQPIDYVGESFLESGKYSYILDIIENKLQLEFVED